MSGRRRRRVAGVSGPGKVKFAREQRREPTRAEQMLWRAVRWGRLGVRFRRQHPIDSFVLDFYCAEAQLAVEIDGPAHDEQQGYDHWRDAQLGRQGIRVLRLPEELVRTDLASALKTMRKALSERR